MGRSRRDSRGGDNRGSSSSGGGRGEADAWADDGMDAILAGCAEAIENDGMDDILALAAEAIEDEAIYSGIILPPPTSETTRKRAFDEIADEETVCQVGGGGKP